MKAFDKKDRIAPNWWQNLLGIAPPENAVIDLNNLLASKTINDVTFADLKAIEEEYGINIHKRFEGHLKALYRKLLEASLRDNKLSNAESEALKHLKHLFRFSDKEVDVIHNEVAARFYGKRLEEVLQDHQINEEESNFLQKLQNDLRLCDETINKVHREKAGDIYKQLMDEAISDERLSPDEEEELAELATNLGLDVDFDEATKKKLARYRLYWQIENGELPEEDVRINLYKNETCYFHSRIDWYEHRHVTKRLNYSGPTLRIKIAQGLYWRAGSLSGHTTSEDVTKYIDSGELYLTNKRILFIGSRKNKRIYLKRILDFDAYTNGVQVQKVAGKSPFFASDQNVDVFAMILGRLLFREE